jgi:hypothetical protein
MVALLLIPAGLRARDTNGEDWQIFDRSMRVAYVKAVYDTSEEILGREVYKKIHASDNSDSFEKELGEANRWVPRASAVTIGDVMEAISRFYAAPENRPTAILTAMEIVAAKFNGASEACISEQTLLYRMMMAHVEDATDQKTKVLQVCKPDQTSIGRRAEDAASERGSDLDPQAKCSKDADAYFTKEFGNESAHLDHYSSHYSRKSDSCFLKIVYKPFKEYGDHYYMNIWIWDVHRGDFFATYFDYARVNADGTIEGGHHIQCTIGKVRKLCKSEAEFNEAIKPYTED